jgi:hypothetical protein
MDAWEIDFEWLKVRHYVKDAMHRDTLPDLNSILFLIGIQELGQLRKAFSKEEKQDLMHIAVCRVLSNEGFYEFEGIDAEGWPHWKSVKAMSPQNLRDQELLLKRNIIQYFKTLEKAEA